MAQHQFQVGQMVDLIPDRRNADIPGGSYTVQRLMPAEGRDPQYRVKNARDGHERVVRESQLSDRLPGGPSDVVAVRRTS